MKNTQQRIAVYGLIFNQLSEILVVKRSASDSHPGLWELPGGALIYGEDPDKGALREIKEETNLNVTLFYPLLTMSGFSSKMPNTHVVRIIFLCQAKDPTSLILSSEHIDYQWLQPDRINVSPLSDLLPKTLQTINKYQDLLAVIT